MEIGNQCQSASGLVENLNPGPRICGGVHSAHEEIRWASRETWQVRTTNLAIVGSNFHSFPRFSDRLSAKTMQDQVFCVRDWGSDDLGIGQRPWIDKVEDSASPPLRKDRQKRYQIIQNCDWSLHAVHMLESCLNMANMARLRKRTTLDFVMMMMDDDTGGGDHRCDPSSSKLPTCPKGLEHPGLNWVGRALWWPGHFQRNSLIPPSSVSKQCTLRVNHHSEDHFLRTFFSVLS